MRILNVTAQKPNSTGSGIFLSELMKEFANKGHTQALVAGVYPEEETPVPDRVTFYPVYFEQGKLSFPIVGMSDEMPYPSTRYRDMTPKMEAAFKESFLKQLDEAVRDLNPDLILCHHLYLLTAIVREHFPDRKVLDFAIIQICGRCRRQIWNGSTLRGRFEDLIGFLHCMQSRSGPFRIFMMCRKKKYR